MKPVLQARLFGRFRISAVDNQDLTPKSSKGQGLLALLLVSPDLERGRLWLQDKLWSDRGSEQGARSLRQELSQLKKSLGPYSAVLIADRKSVALNKDMIEVEDGATSLNAQFLEGLDIRDPEFNSWLVSQRTKQGYENLPVDAKGQSVALVGLSAQSAACKVFEAQMLETCQKSLSDLCDVTTFRKLPNALASFTFLVGVQVFEVPGHDLSVRLTIERVTDAATVWSETLSGIKMSEYSGLDLPCLQLINRLFEQSCRVFVRQDAIARTPNALASLAITKTFAIEDVQLREAAQMFARAFEMEPRGSYLAWQAQIIIIQTVERFGHDPLALREEGERLCAEALRLDPTNSNVLAAASNFRTIVERNVAAGLELARLAVRANSANPLSWWALSNAVQYTGDEKQAYLAAVRASQLAVGTKLEFWTAFQRSLAAMLMQKPAEARQFGELSSALSPDFKPPLRYLGALYAANDDTENTQRVFGCLSKKESDFSIERFAHDPEYPVRLMRTSGLLDVEKINKLIT